MIVNQYGGITHAANPRDGVGKVGKIHTLLKFVHF